MQAGGLHADKIGVGLVRAAAENAVKHLAIAALLFALLSGSSYAAPPIVQPYEADAAFVPVNPIDEHVRASLKKHNIEPAALCSDEVFVRRVYLDVIGTLPEPAEVRAFLKDKRAGKRAALIDDLLKREEFADYWALKWCDVLRVKSEFPINLWPNAVQAYHHWVRDELAQNRPYDEFVRALLTSSGSNFRVPPANFYRAVQGQEPSALAAAVALTFMGTRLESWPGDRRAGMEAFFSRVAFKKTAEWKEEIVYVDATPTGLLGTVFPDGTPAQIPPTEDPRRVFADWLIRADNPWFARCAVNRVWAWLMGRGIIDEPDDIRSDNPPVNPELLAYLESALVDANYDLRQIYRLILNSRTYQQSSIARSDGAKARMLFACYPVRQLDAEVLIDALNTICGTGEQYTSVIPEPFTYIPDTQRTIALADGSISSPFLELFGRPARDTGLMSERDNRPTDNQRLHLLNSSDVHAKLERGPRMRELMQIGRRDTDRLVDTLYLTVLSRHPTEDERAVVEAHVSADQRGARREAIIDVVWALVNTKEFLYRH